MKYFIICCFVFLFGFIAFKSVQFKNPHKLVMIWGKKGSGKTTLATKLTQKHLKQGDIVFSNAEIYGAYKLDVKDIGFKTFPVNSVLIVDEASLVWDNRDFKKFDTEHVGRYFRLQRQYKNTVYLFSQNFDIDKKLRDLTDEMYLCVNLFGFISVAKKIKKTPKLHKVQQNEDGQKNGEGFITEDFRYYFPTQWIFTYIPRYIKFFSSFSPDSLPPVDRIKYTFDNDLYLWKYQRYAFYKLEQLRDVKRSFAYRKKMRKLSFVMSGDDAFRLLGIY